MEKQINTRSSCMGFILWTSLCLISMSEGVNRRPNFDVRRGNFCPRVETKMVACRVPNGTETYQGRVKVGNRVQLMTMKRPRLIPSFKEVSEVVYGCCPGFEGSNCDAACFNCTQMHDLASRVKTLEAKILRNPSWLTSQSQKKSPSIKMGLPDTSHVKRRPDHRRQKPGRNRGGNRKRNRNGGTRSDIDIEEEAGEDAFENSVQRSHQTPRPFLTRRESQSCRCPPGPPGPPGLPGLPGNSESSSANEVPVVHLPGAVGPPGVPGLPGKIGPPGLPGQGITGPMGLPGKDGLDGAIGSQGERGFPGIPGLPGQQGMKGDRGIDGKHGAPGIPGERGPLGPSGLRGDKGDIGLPGKPGEPGPPGIGFPGPQGLPGPPGQGLYFPDVDDEGSGYGLFADNEDENYRMVGGRGLPDQKGEKGAKGELGRPGYTGEKGERGFYGVRGPPGETGLTGLPGIKGDRGEPGQPSLNLFHGTGSDPSVPQSVSELSEIVGELRRSVNLLDSRIRILEVELPKIISNTKFDSVRFPGHPDDPHTNLDLINNQIGLLNGIVDNVLPNSHNTEDSRAPQLPLPSTEIVTETITTIKPDLPTITEEWKSSPIETTTPIFITPQRNLNFPDETEVKSEGSGDFIDKFTGSPIDDYDYNYYDSYDGDYYFEEDHFRKKKRNADKISKTLSNDPMITSTTPRASKTKRISKVKNFSSLLSQNYERRLLAVNSSSSNPPRSNSHRYTKFKTDGGDKDKAKLEARKKFKLRKNDNKELTWI